MCKTHAIVLNSAWQAIIQMEQALAAADVDGVLARAQCLWVLCEDTREFDQRLGCIERLSVDWGGIAANEHTRLLRGLAEVRQDYAVNTGRSLLAEAAA